MCFVLLRSEWLGDKWLCGKWLGVATSCCNCVRWVRACMCVFASASAPVCRVFVCLRVCVTSVFISSLTITLVAFFSLGYVCVCVLFVACTVTTALLGSLDRRNCPVHQKHNCNGSGFLFARVLPVHPCVCVALCVVVYV